MSETTIDLLEVARRLTDEEIDMLARNIDDELVGSDPRPTLKALRELGQGHTGTGPVPSD